jgi:hypothetical protein
MIIDFRSIFRSRQALFQLFTASDRSAAGVKAKLVPHLLGGAFFTRNSMEAGILRKKVRKAPKLTESHGL